METRVAPPGPYGKEGRIGRGWRLTKVAWALIRRDRTMLALAFTGVASATVFTALIFVLGGYFSHASGEGRGQVGMVALIAFYPSVLVSVFFNVALASAASAAFDGERLSVGEAIRMAWGKRVRIAAWALITAVVGLIISELAERLPGGSRIVGWLAGAAWGLATIFVVPILAIDSVGALAATKRSARMVRSRWGEGVTGNIAIGAWVFLAAIPAGLTIAIGAATIQTRPEVGSALIATGVVAMVAISTVSAATRQVFAVALYRYAIDAPVGAFRPADLDRPFISRDRRGRGRSRVLRIGVPILALLVIFVILAGFVGSRLKTAANGYFEVHLPTSTVTSLEAGSPVTAATAVTGARRVIYRSGRIGTVRSVTVTGSDAFVEFGIDPRYRAYVEGIRGQAVGSAGHQAVCFGSAPACRRSSSPVPGRLGGARFDRQRLRGGEQLSAGGEDG